MTSEYLDMLRALLDAEVDFLLVGAHARAVHGTPRATGNLDIWVKREPANSNRLFKALVAFGAPLSDLSESEFLDPEMVFQIGLAPNRIDLLTDISGVTFEQAWPRRLEVQLCGMTIPVIGRDDYIVNKRATGRMKDLADVEDIEENGAP